MYPLKSEEFSDGEGRKLPEITSRSECYPNSLVVETCTLIDIFEAQFVELQIRFYQNKKDSRGIALKSRQTKFQIDKIFLKYL